MTCVTWHVIVIYFLATLYALTLTFSGMTFLLMQYPSQTFISFLCEFEVLAAHVTVPTAQNVIAVLFYL